MAKEILYRGKKIEELEKMGYNELAELLPCRIRRNLKRGFTEKQKILLGKIKDAKEGKRKRPIKTHCRDMCILPEMVGVTVHIHSGKQYFQLPMMGKLKYLHFRQFRYRELFSCLLLQL